MQTLKTGVLVIGGGGAAARTAWEASRAGAEVTLVTKGSFGAIGTRGAGATASGFSASGVFATPGWSGRLTQIETRVAHMVAAPLERSYSNILQAGLGMADPRLAQILVEDAVNSRQSLLDIGVTFGEYGLRSHGVPIMAALISQIRKSDIKIIERTMIIQLLTREGECSGAVAIDENTGEPLLIQSAATVLATGGDSNLFLLNLNPECNTGDGYTLGYNCGAELINLEFKQIFLGTVFPTRNMLTQALPPYVKLTNVDHKEFLQDYLPQGVSSEECLAQRNSHNPFSSRDKYSRFVDFAMIGELAASRATTNHGIYLDRSDPRNPPLALPASEFWAYRGIDFVKPVEVGICHHCSLGGLRIDQNAETTVPRLLAAGEVAAGPHGADRMGGHMLLAEQVFGARAGKRAAFYANQGKHFDQESRQSGQVQSYLDSLRGNGGPNHPAEVKKALQKTAYFNLLTLKSQESLKGLIDFVRSIKADIWPKCNASSPRDLIEVLELHNLLTLAEIESAVCLNREESRGPHYRSDFPVQDDEHWLKSITVKKIDDRMQIDTLALDPRWQSQGDEKMGYWG